MARPDGSQALLLFVTLEASREGLEKLDPISSDDQAAP